jgi:hypothetical protein
MIARTALPDAPVLRLRQGRIFMSLQLSITP